MKCRRRSVVDEMSVDELSWNHMKVEDDLGPINSLKIKGRQFQAEGPIQKRV